MKFGLDVLDSLFILQFCLCFLFEIVSEFLIILLNRSEAIIAVIEVVLEPSHVKLPVLVLLVFAICLHISDLFQSFIKLTFGMQLLLT